VVDDVSLGERSDRTADFIGLLPVTRKQIILSKWLISIIVLAGCAAFHSVSAIVGTIYYLRRIAP
jgi:ABC-type transport system involved in multi-copper enzyme maturation permease subunit